MEAEQSAQKNNKEFTEKMEIEITDRMIRLLSVTDFLCNECHTDLHFLYCVWKEATYSQRKKVEDLLATLGLTKLFIEIWKKYFEMDFLSDGNSIVCKIMRSIILLLCYCMSSSKSLCVQAFESDLHKVALNYLKTDYLDPSKTVESNGETVISCLISILHNILQKVPESSQSLREQKAFDVLQRFRKSPSSHVACMALVLQGYIITEKENELVNSDDSDLLYLKDTLEMILMPDNYSEKSDDHFSPIEVLSALNRLAVNDNNKTRIVRVGLLPFYVKLLQPQYTEEEREAAAEGLWTLAFKCKHEIENEPGCVAALEKLAAENSKRLKRLAAGVLWTLGESKRKKNPSGQDSRSGQDSQRHVFISYQWDSQPMIKKLVSSLKEEGFRVWVDIDNMAGSILEAMARAVEEAVVVIVCLSQKYKESPNCRTEAEYSYKLHKDILPLLLQSHYSPDGWLGALVGNRLYHNFTSDGKYSESIKTLIKELGVRGKATELKVDEHDSKVDKVTKASVSTTGSSGDRISKYANWTSEQIVSWLKDNKLEEYQDWFKDFDGTLLSEYKAMLENAPEAFYSELRGTFSRTNMLKLSKALKQL